MKEIVIKICGIDCAACVDRLNRTLGETDGVLEAAVNYAAGSAYLRYDEEKLGIPDIARCIRKAGYEVPLGRAELYCEGLDPERSDEYIAAVSAIDEVQSARSPCFRRSSTRCAVRKAPRLPCSALRTK